MIFIISLLIGSLVDFIWVGLKLKEGSIKGSKVGLKDFIQPLVFKSNSNHRHSQVQIHFL
jgi:hypothetical protein